MIAQIIVKKAVKDGVKGFVFVEFKNVLELKDLPNEYCYENPCFCLSEETFLKVSVRYEPLPKKFKINDFISKEDFNNLISVLKEAGQRLTDIKKKRNWVSDKKITINI